MTDTTFESVTARVGQLDWSQLVRQLDEQGFAVTKPVLSAEQIEDVVAYLTTLQD